MSVPGRLRIRRRSVPVGADSDTSGLASEIDNGDRGRIMVYWQTRSAVPVLSISEARPLVSLSAPTG
jgi:hypothetical protein